MRKRLAILILLAASVGLNVVPVWWGISADPSWAFDEITPSQVMGKREWPPRYPPLYRFALRPVLRLNSHLNSGSDDQAKWSTPEDSLLLMRLIAVAMGTLTIVMVFMIGQMVAGRVGALFAAGASALSPSFVYYAKTANLELPYLAAFAIAMYFAFRWSASGRTVDAIGLAIVAAASIALKDQAFALYPLIPLAWVARRPHASSDPKMSRSRLIAHVLLVATTGVLALAIFYGLPHHWAECEKHFRTLIRYRHSKFRVWPPTLTGHFRMLVAAIRNWAFVDGVLLAGLAVFGAFGLVRHRETRPMGLLLILPAVSYYAFFIAPIGWHYVRFFLPLGLLGSVAAGYGAQTILRSQSISSLIRTSVIAIVLAFSAFRAVSVDLLMLNDTRYEAENWIQSHIPGKSIIGISLLPRLLPRKVSSTPWRRLPTSDLCSQLKSLDADYLAVLRTDQLEIDGGSASMQLLISGSGGYRVLRDFPRPRLARWLISTDESTNLDKIAPPLTILARSGRTCRDADWALSEASAILQAPSGRRFRQLKEYLLGQSLPGLTVLAPGVAALGVNPTGKTRGSSPAILMLTNQSSALARPTVTVIGLASKRGENALMTAYTELGVRRDNALNSQALKLPLDFLEPRASQMLILATSTVAPLPPGGSRPPGLRIVRVKWFPSTADNLRPNAPQ